MFKLLFSVTFIEEIAATLRESNHQRKLPAAWIVSHCRTFSDREGYVEQLQRFISVDIYGKCGTIKCPDTQDRYNNTE